MTPEEKEIKRLKDLIRAYAEHVAQHEGVDFLRPADETSALTPEQFRELQILCNGNPDE